MAYDPMHPRSVTNTLPPEKLGGIALAGEAELPRLMRDLARMNDDMELRFSGLRKLMDMTNRVDPGALLDEVLQRVHERFAGILPYERLGLALLDDRGENLEERWVKSSARAVKLDAGYSAPLRKTSLGPLLKSGDVRIINDLAGHLVEHHTSVHTRLMLQEGMRANLTVPLLVAERPIGFLFFSSSQSGVYEEGHGASLRLMAQQLATLLSKARIYEMVLKAQLESDRLLRNVLPEPIVKRLKAGEQIIADGIAEATVVFVDIVNFVRTASALSPTAVIIVLNRIFSAFDALCEQYGVEKIKTIGDAYMLATGVPDPMPDHTAVAARIALDMQELGQRLGTREEGRMSFRIGIHTGPVIAGVIGTRKFSYDLWGDTVNVASRMESHGMPGRIHVTRAVYERLRNDFEFESRGLTLLKGMGEMETFFLNAARPGASGRHALPLDLWRQGSTPDDESSPGQEIDRRIV